MAAIDKLEEPIILPSSDKIENEGKTSQGRASANEWNLLVKAVVKLRDALLSLKAYVDEKAQERITTDTILDESSNNAIANSVVATNINFIKNAISNYLNKFRSKGVEVIDSNGNARANLTADNVSATLTATDNLNINAENGTLKTHSSSAEVFGESQATIKSDNVAGIVAGESGVFADATDNKVHIVGDDTEFTYRTTDENGEQQESVVTLRNILLGGKLITYDQYKAIKKKEMITYYVAKDEEALKRNKCWRIYLRAQLVGEFDVEGNLTLPVFPMRFPFRLV